MAFGGEDLDKVSALFRELGVETAFSNVDDFKRWVKSHEEKKVEVKDEHQRDHHHEDKYLQVRDGRPRISTFCGSSTQKEATPWDVWKYEVECYLKSGTHTREAILEGVRRSLKGDAAKAVMRLGPSASIQEILHKLEGLYGTVAKEGALLSQFYAAQQKEDEDVTAWSCRLEDVIQKVRERGLISEGTMKEMLRSKLWSGLRSETLKNATRYKYDLVKNFEELVIEIRSVEQELGTSVDKKKVKSQSLQKTEVDNTYDLMKKMNEKLDKLEKDVVLLKAEREAVSHLDVKHKYDSSRKRGRGSNWRGRWTGNNQQTAPSENKTCTDDNPPARSTVVCYRCGQHGHVALGCRVRTDHLRHLNEESPLQGGKQ